MNPEVFHVATQGKHVDEKLLVDDDDDDNDDDDINDDDNEDPDRDDNKLRVRECDVRKDEESRRAPEVKRWRMRFQTDAADGAQQYGVKNSKQKNFFPTNFF